MLLSEQLPSEQRVCVSRPSRTWRCIGIGGYGDPVIVHPAAVQDRVAVCAVAHALFGLPGRWVATGGAWLDRETLACAGLTAASCVRGCRCAVGHAHFWLSGLECMRQVIRERTGVSGADLSCTPAVLGQSRLAVASQLCASAGL